MFVRPWRSSAFRSTGPGTNRRAEFPVPSLWAKLLEEIRLGHSSAERRSGIANIKNRLSGPCTGGTGTTVLWFPARAVWARPFSGSQHGGAWPGGGALRCCRKPNREAKPWRRWWCWSTRLHSVRRSRAPTSKDNASIASAHSRQVGSLLPVLIPSVRASSPMLNVRPCTWMRFKSQFQWIHWKPSKWPHSSQGPGGASEQCNKYDQIVFIDCSLFLIG